MRETQERARTWKTIHGTNSHPSCHGGRCPWTWQSCVEEQPGVWELSKGHSSPWGLLFSSPTQFLPVALSAPGHPAASVPTVAQHAITTGAKRQDRWPSAPAPELGLLSSPSPDPTLKWWHHQPPKPGTGSPSSWVSHSTLAPDLYYLGTGLGLFHLSGGSNPYPIIHLLCGLRQAA
jgi:hypothetical protein